MIQMETIEKIRALMKLMPRVSSMPESKKLVESGDAEVILRNPMLKDTLEYYRRTEKRYQYLMGRLEDMLRKNEVSLEHVRELLEDVTCFD
jgi:PHD/YefM family antitoxin component YafN of YafNO toxin-antitoxin module